MPMLTNLKITKLFGLYDYHLQFSESGQDKIRFVTAPNGYGKSTILRFIDGISYSRISMEEKMEKHYSRSDFYKTSLFAEINRYCSSFGIDAKST